MTRPTQKRLLKLGKYIAKTVLKFRDKGRLLSKPVEDQDFKDANNQTREIDKQAQGFASILLLGFYGNAIEILGEEAGDYPDSLEGHPKVIAIIDPIDGTDLFARGFSNWCCSMVFFDPRSKSILAAVVGHSSGEIYYASDEGAFKQTLSGEEERLQVNPNAKLALANASLCFYGQKPKNFLTLADNQTFLGLLKTFERRMKGKGNKVKGEKLGFRLYNFAGNPMMAKIPDGTVDAVIELSGQFVHDVVPGAYIATRAGAVFVGLDGAPINLENSLLNPNRKLTYILAGSKFLAKEIMKAINSNERKTRAH